MVRWEGVENVIGENFVGESVVSSCVEEVVGFEDDLRAGWSGGNCTEHQPK